MTATITRLWPGPWEREVIKRTADAWASMDALEDGQHPASAGPDHTRLFEKHKAAAAQGQPRLCHLAQVTPDVLEAIWTRLYDTGGVTEYRLTAALLARKAGGS
jgi:hypothetical protein